MDKPKVEFNLFGKIEVTYLGETFDLSKYLGKQLINLLMVLIMSPEHELSKDDLVDMLWKESENPQNVMKFTVFRLRKDLDRIPSLRHMDLIVTTKKGYALSKDYDYEIDLDRFNVLKNYLQDKEEYNRQDYAKAKRLIDLYHGFIYKTSTQPSFVREISEQCHEIYCHIVNKVCQNSFDKGEYQKMLEIVYKALLIEPFNEQLHYFYMSALIKLRDYHKAMQYYDEIQEVFYRELQEEPSMRLKTLYESISKEDEHKIKDDIIHLQNDLMDKNYKPQGFYCGYTMFKYIRELLLNNPNTNYKKYYLVLFELQSEKNIMLDSTLITRFKYLIMNSIRTNDLFTKVNEQQFALLLGCNEVEDVEQMIHHITSEFYKKFASHRYRLAYSMIETKQG